ncbi:hypothetical protein COJ01_17870 [Priestia megaterium]|uniref:hypothetical protein n=1 Tax=Priestia megaterium TaxID=1404 RepID=UPI000BF26DDE|nr:hypothetical protein [Priestia megaterium]PFK99915.1 hypothetical protein COJ01_17870 [Priestia megaterium]
MFIAQIKILNIIALNIVMAEVKADEYRKFNDFQKMNVEYGKSIALRELAEQLGADDKYFNSLINSLTKEEVH